jgi:peptidyl-prolyl cis-trans isomerase SurA
MEKFINPFKTKYHPKNYHYVLVILHFEPILRNLKDKIYQTMLKRILVSFCLATIMTVPLLAKDKEKSPVLMTIAGDPITVKEFKYIYEKNNSKDKSLYDSKNLNEYLTLFTNFKLKVKAGFDAGIDTSAKFLKEYKQYRSQLATPYLTDKEVSTRLMDEAYNRLQNEVRASHILIMVPQDGSPKKWDSAMKVINKIKDSLRKGADFAVVAKKYSQDPSAQYNSGDLGYFSAFMMIYPFENAAFNMNKVGDISEPIKTQFGYHIIKLTDKRPYRGERKVRSILINDNEKYTDPERKLAKNKIDSVFAKLNKGADFATMAKNYSEHLQSKENGGELPWFNSFATYPEEFMNQAFALKKAGEYTKPFQTLYGWHILQLIDIRPLKPKSELTEYLKNKIARDSRSEQSKESALIKFRTEYGIKSNPKKVDKNIALIDTSILTGHYKAQDKNTTDDVVIKIGKPSKEGSPFPNKFTFRDFAIWMEKNQTAGKSKDVKSAVDIYFNEYYNYITLAYADADLDNKFEEFKNVSREYKEGIMLFEISDRNVWSKAATDTFLQKAYYEKNKAKYFHKERAEASIFEFNSSATIKSWTVKERKVKEKVKTKGKFKTINKIQFDSLASDIPLETYIQDKLKAGISPDKIASEIGQTDPLLSTFTSGLYEKGENTTVDLVNRSVGIWNTTLSNNRKAIVSIKAIHPTEPKKFTEVKGQVISELQDSLEKEWLDNLHKKYTVNIDQIQLKKLEKK